MITQRDIRKAVRYMMNKGLAPITRPYNNFIVLAQNEQDFKSKTAKIRNGDTEGFYKIEYVLKELTTTHQ